MDPIQTRGMPSGGRNFSKPNFSPSFAGRADVSADCNGATARKTKLRSGKFPEKIAPADSQQGAMPAPNNGEADFTTLLVKDGVTKY